MAGRPLGCLTGTGIVAALATLLVVGAAAAATQLDIFSPGALSSAHAATTPSSTSTALRAATQCSDCHPAFWTGATITDKCVACHVNISHEMGDPTSMHAVFTASNTCRDCHTEHQGLGATISSVTLEQFPHTSVGFSLQAHLFLFEDDPAACKTCHPDTVRELALGTCVTCHLEEDLDFTSKHIETFGPNCLACHDGLDSYGKAFDHQLLSFPLVGEHAKLECAACHASATTLTALRSTPSTCAGCHAPDDPHDGRLGDQCEGCHTPEEWKITTFDHALTGFPLVGNHITLQCESCHVAGQWAGVPETCAGCHAADDIHDGRLGVQCQNCHTPDGWEGATFDHAVTGFPLAGKHGALQCASCHVGGQWAGVPDTCAGCHAGDDIHDGRLGVQCQNCHTTTGWGGATFDHSLSGFALTGRHATLTCTKCHAGEQWTGLPQTCIGCHAKDDRHAGGFGNQCQACHNTSSWSNVTFDHKLSGFPLTGAHAKLPCMSCHTDGFLSNLPTSCSGCHAEPAVHAGAFGLNCANCHSTSAWLPAGFNGPHPFPMNHGGAGGKCETCHPNSLTGYTCYTCHNQNEIIKKHQEEGITNLNNCVKCHAGGKGGD